MTKSIQKKSRSLFQRSSKISRRKDKKSNFRSGNRKWGKNFQMILMLISINCSTKVLFISSRKSQDHLQCLVLKIVWTKTLVKVPKKILIKNQKKVYKSKWPKDNQKQTLKRMKPNYWNKSRWDSGPNMQFIDFFNQ